LLGLRNDDSSAKEKFLSSPPNAPQAPIVTGDEEGKALLRTIAMWAFERDEARTPVQMRE
jgi:hypothetical protein